jgi:hypothetical protein
VINASLNRKQDSPLPRNDNDTDLANEFVQFFDDKIKRLRTKLDSQVVVDATNDTPHNHTSKLTEFKMLTQDEVKKYVLSMPSKHCKLDPLPTWLIKECLDELLPLLTLIVNTSLKLGIMPCGLKHAIIKPLLKKAGLETKNASKKTIDQSQIYHFWVN